MTSDAAATSRMTGDRNARLVCWEWLLVWFSFGLIASWVAPIPGVNEPHYFTKARHFWDPEWCARDPFLQSANAHYVFYATFGMLTTLFSFNVSAWIGRLLGWGLLAAGWCAISRQFSRERGSAFATAWIFLGLATIGNWSGEWVVGGIEAKVVSYGCAWWSLARMLQGNPVWAAAWAGAAVTFHPVVGIWHTGAIGLAVLLTREAWPFVRRLRTILLSILVWWALAIPGLIPALAMIRAADPQAAYTADYVQVYYRLSHHLDPYRFRTEANLYFAVLVGFLLISYWMLRRVSFRTDRTTVQTNGSVPNSGHVADADSESQSLKLVNTNRLLFRYVMVAVAVALCGVLVRLSPDIARIVLNSGLFPGIQGPLRAIVDYQNHLPKWLKFYPFRLADVVVPMAVSLHLFRWLQIVFRNDQSGTEAKLQTTSHRLRFVPTCVVIGIITGTLWGSAHHAPNESYLSQDQHADYLACCRWIRSETPSDSLCFIPAQGFGFKWYAERAEYVSHKDCPQDAAGIVAWNNRFRFIANWSTRQTPTGYSRAMLRELREKTGIDYVITPMVGSKLAPLKIPPVYQNASYQVFRLLDANEDGMPITSHSNKTGQ